MMRRHHWVFCLVLTLVCGPICGGVRAAGPEIVGSARFGGQVRRALGLLRARDPAAYRIVTGYVGRIQEGARSGMWAYKTPPTFEVNDATAFYSVTWCAATMAHDSLHAKLYRDYQKAHGGGAVPDAVWTGSAAERLCMRHQLAVMRRIGAPPREIAYAETQADGRYVPDRETWGDYKKRAW